MLILLCVFALAALLLPLLVARIGARAFAVAALVPAAAFAHAVVLTPQVLAGRRGPAPHPAGVRRVDPAARASRSPSGWTS